MRFASRNELVPDFEPGFGQGFEPVASSKEHTYTYFVVVVALEAFAIDRWYSYQMNRGGRIEKASSQVRKFEVDFASEAASGHSRDFAFAVAFAAFESKKEKALLGKWVTRH